MAPMYIYIYICIYIYIPMYSSLCYRCHQKRTFQVWRLPNPTPHAHPKTQCAGPYSSSCSLVTAWVSVADTLYFLGMVFLIFLQEESFFVPRQTWAKKP